MSDLKLFRRNQIVVSDETLFYLKLEAQRMVANTDATMTESGVAEGLIREVLTNANPEWVVLHHEHEELKKETARKHREIDERAFSK